MKRVRTACENCRRRKARCDGSEPCRQCQLAGITCNYPVQRSSRGRIEVERNTSPPADCLASDARRDI
ncbi:hypothetical protein BGW36DRAFT_81854 [Talaromyces proteolyticus]|uniref:Zn(2)-C6 fungal-type domain-containing protein n=1 Tax=Talaromyces proteolyticus TaxID=1131652 RepID=A0AAD4KDT6_9EURO|nr:uncharacterized protein BGW36DRAFT_81854 [Talaromyces proteolyticus]KAH8688650.1 hypothetical protein BGW36DRAFT_81854 [Talaromyces proteolyticus]